MIAPLPGNEAARIAALRGYRILDTPPEPAFDDLAGLAAHICETPVALVSLVDERRAWFKSRVGLTLRETPRDRSFCARAILQSGPLVVRDAAADARFVRSPLVTGAPHIRFYAGSPIVTPQGHPLGAVCVMDRVARDLAPAQAAGLTKLARQAMAQLELRRHAAGAEAAMPRSEEQLGLSQRLEAVGRLAGGIAHEFNNILTAILGQGEVLLAKLSHEHPFRAPLEEITRSSARAASLVRDLLAFGRRQTLKPRVLDLNAILRDVEGLLRRLAGEATEVTVVPAPAPCLTKADPAQIEQVLVNLVVNAREAMPAGGRLVVEAAAADLAAGDAPPGVPLAAGRYVVLAVTDTGRGMDAETQARVFEPFFTTKEAGRGAGLGLSTVYGIVKQSGGYVWADSAPGRGTTFRVCLPRADGPAGEGAVARQAAGGGGGETILVVEDEELVRSLARDVLAREGYQVLEASRGDEALAVAARHAGPIDLLLTDVVMPGMSGPEVAEQLAAARPGLRVLFMSGYPRGQGGLHGTLDPSAPLLEKPFRLAGLTSRVREVLGARAAG